MRIAYYVTWWTNRFAGREEETLTGTGTDRQAIANDVQWTDTETERERVCLLFTRVTIRYHRN